MKEKTTYKFKFDYLNNRLWRIEDEYSYEISDEQTFTTDYGGQGFILDSNQPNHWINFTIHDRSIRAFYKKVNRVNGKEETIYYQKDIPREEIIEFVIEFELTEDDIVAKKDSKWVKKNSEKV